MGCDAADINNDGLIDLAVVDMAPDDHIKSKTTMGRMNPRGVEFLTVDIGFHHQHMFNSLQLNRGNGKFSDIGLMSGTSKTDWSWAALLADFDNDGDKDYFITNGYYRLTRNNDWKLMLKEEEKKGRYALTNEDYYNLLLSTPQNKIPNYFFENEGNLHFLNRSEDWADPIETFSTGAAYSDLDADGDLDIIVNNIADEALLYRNNSNLTNNSFSTLNLINTKDKVPIQHSKVTLYAQGIKQFLELTNSRGYQSGVDNQLHFGVKEAVIVDSIIVEWLDGTVNRLSNIPVNQLITVDKKDGKRKSDQRKLDLTLLEEYPVSQLGINYKHRENSFNDFKKEILLPHKQSQMGPALAVGDANGDGLEDFYIGGAKGTSGMLYGQSNKGTFYPAVQTLWEKNKQSEETDALFFDADQDGDLDLYVACGGGGDFEPKSPALQDRLYINDGKGSFARALSALPPMNNNSSTVKAADFDNDGDLDLFVGGRGVPGRYPQPDRSYLLRNDGSKFADVTSELIPDLQQSGMISDVIWSDFDQDDWMDLIVVGEWMPIRFFKNKKGTFKEVSNQTGLGNTNGWWYSIEKIDWNSDNYPDFVIGNVGKNTKYKASKEKPLYLYANDFDNSGSLDIVLASHYKGKLVPIRGRQCSSEQMPFINEKFPTYQEFAEASLHDILDPIAIKEAASFQAQHFESIILENKGNGKFSWHVLPTYAQLAPVRDILVCDINQDHIDDIILVGNMFGTEVETPRYDAGMGLILQGDRLEGV